MAKRKRVKTAAINEQIKRGKLPYVKMALVKFIYDFNAAVDFHAQHPELINFDYKTLVWLPDFAISKGLAPRTLYEEIIFGRINAFTAGDKIFIQPQDPTIAKFFEERTRKRRRRGWEIKVQGG